MLFFKNYIIDNNIFHGGLHIYLIMKKLITPNNNYNYYLKEWIK